jgi:molecular chaperone GrpE
MSASDQVDTFNTDSQPSPASNNAVDSAQSGSGNTGAPLQDQLTAAKKEASENYDRYLRSVADLENFRRRSVREKDELRQFAIARVLEDLLPVLDNLGLGLAAAKAPNADLQTLAGGISMVQEQLKTALANHGLKEINPAGQTFDPNQHESIASQPSATVPEGSVAQVVRTGYSLNGRLVRPASVVVSSGPGNGAAKT